MEVKGICFKCVMFLIDGFVDVDLWGKEVLCDVNGDYVGCLILGGYFVYFGKQIGMGYVKFELVELGIKFKVKIMGEFYDVEIVEDSFYDFKNVNICIDG